MSIPNMKILCIIPPYVPSYFNAGHHLPLFQVGAYLRKHIGNCEVQCVDLAALNSTWKEVCDLLVSKFDVIVVQNDFDAIDTFPRLMKYISVFCPQAETITFGRLSKQIPRFFFQFGFDAVHCSGDYEAGIINFVNYISGNVSELQGVITKENYANKSSGVILSADDWELPDVAEIPYDDYSRMYSNDLNKFCGIPQRKELVVPVARGCPIGCNYCDVAGMQGTTERRLSVDRTVDYIVTSFNKLPFEYLSFYAPTFTINKSWVLDMCIAISSLTRRYPWKCVTLISRLDEQLITAMAKSGCIRISFGIETFSENAGQNLPICKQNTKEKFVEVVNCCKKNNVEVNCFLMLGLPGDSPEALEDTLNLCMKLGARVRPTLYTPYHLLRDDMSLQEVSNFNRQIFIDNFLPEEAAHKYYRLFYSNKNDRPTMVMNNIKKASDYSA